MWMEISIYAESDRERISVRMTMILVYARRENEIGTVIMYIQKKRLVSLASGYDILTKSVG